MHQTHKLFPPRSHVTIVNIDICCQWEVLRKSEAWPHRASAAASALTLGQCLRLDMTLTLGVGCTGVNQCVPLQASTLTLGVVRPLV